MSDDTNTPPEEAWIAKMRRRAMPGVPTEEEWLGLDAGGIDITAELAEGLGDPFAPLPWPSEAEIAAEVARQERMRKDRAYRDELTRRKEAGEIPWSPTDLKFRARAERQRKRGEAALAEIARQMGLGPEDDPADYQLVALRDGRPVYRRKP